MSCHFRNRMLHGRFSGGKEESKSKAAASDPTPQPPPAPNDKSAAPKDDPEVEKVSSDLSKNLQVEGPAEPWWEKVGKPGHDKYARYYERSAWQIERESAEARNRSNDRPRGQTWSAAGRGRGGSGTGQAHTEQRNTATDQAPAQVADSRRKPRRPWKTEKEKRASPPANKEPEKFVFSSVKVNLDSINERSAGLSRVDPQYKAFLVSLAESCAKECGGKEENWDD